jgi:hypothetical protein
MKGIILAGGIGSRALSAYHGRCQADVAGVRQADDLASVVDCESARRLTPNRVSSLTPTQTFEAVASMMKNGSRARSRLDADGGKVRSGSHRSAASEEKHEPVGAIGAAVVYGLKALDPDRTI